MSSVPTLSRRAPWRRVTAGVLIGLAVAMLLYVLRGTEAIDAIELDLIDARTRHFTGDRPPDERIVICQIEDSDIDEIRSKLGVRWPWPLEYNAHMVRVLDEAGAKVLMVDILHLDRGAGPDDVPNSANLPIGERQLREGEAMSAEDYGAALEAFGRAAVAMELSDRAVFDLAARRDTAESRLGEAPGFARPPWIERLRAELPVRRVARGAALLGFANLQPGGDGVVRQAPLLGSWGARHVMSLPLATAQLVAQIDEKSLPSSSDRVLLVNFRSTAADGGYTRVAPTQLLNWTLRKDETGVLPAAAAEALRDKIVILGVNAAGLKDVVPSPLGTLDGPVFQATVLDNLLHGDGRRMASFPVDTVLLIVLLVLAGALGAGLRGRLPHVVPVGLALLVVLFVYARFDAGVAHDLFTPLLGLVLTWGGTSARRALTEGRRNRWLEGTFGRYMAPSVIQALKDDPALLELGGRERAVTVLFSDVAGFTSLSEGLEPAQLVALLNRYLTTHCDAVLEEGGVVDKFLGDGVLSFFGDPVPQDDHPLRACRAALRVQRELPELEPMLRSLGIDGFQVRMGINTGKAVVGNMGSEQRFDYTCMGDTVNLASRLEGATKAFGIRILLGASTAREVIPEMLVKQLGGIVVVGRAEPASVYELIAARDEASDEMIAHVEAFERALGAARRGDLVEARRALCEAARLMPEDPPTLWFQGVLAGLQGAWDGVTVLTKK